MTVTTRCLGKRQLVATSVAHVVPPASGEKLPLVGSRSRFGPRSLSKEHEAEPVELWQGDRRYVNNLAPDEAADAAAIYGPERYERLASIKRIYDPANIFRLNHNVMPAA